MFTDIEIETVILEFHFLLELLHLRDFFAKKSDISSKSRVAGAMRISKFWLLLQNSPEYM